MEGSIRRLASESLPPGTYFARLTLPQWQEHQGKAFRLLQDREVVYGNLIEPPARGFPLEYRNIIVTSKDPARFSLDIDTPYHLAIGRGAFTTPQQLKYDQQYGVEQHGDIYYSLRGNKVNPKKILITFPGFGPSTSRISYAVSYLKDLTAHDLKDTLMVCFQDRYLPAGSYMMTDNAGRPLFDRINRAIEEMRTRFDIDPAEMLFFGASKGGSIAIQYAQHFPAARLLIAVPQMNLPYYFNKPFFRNNLFLSDPLRRMVQPEDNLRQYFREGRTIDYFYTNSDELSNHSLIELVKDVPHLTKYRIDGGHSEVARAALPAMLGLIREFLHGPQHRSFSCENVRVLPQEHGVQLQARLDQTGSTIGTANWFIEGWLGKTRFRQLMTDHSYNFVKYTNHNQRLFPAYDPLDALSAVVAIEPTRTTWTGRLPQGVVAAGHDDRLDPSSTPLDLEAKQTRSYALLDGDKLSRSSYRSTKANADGDTMELHFVADIDSDVSMIPIDRGTHRASHIAVVELLDGWDLAELLALRFVIASGAPRLLMVLHDVEPLTEAAEALQRVDWPHSTVMATTADDASAIGEMAAHVY